MRFQAFPLRHPDLARIFSWVLSWWMSKNPGAEKILNFCFAYVCVSMYFLYHCSHSWSLVHMWLNCPFVGKSCIELTPQSLYIPRSHLLSFKFCSTIYFIHHSSWYFQLRSRFEYILLSGFFMYSYGIWMSYPYQGCSRLTGQGGPGPPFFWIF